MAEAVNMGCSALDAHYDMKQWEWQNIVRLQLLKAESEG